MRKCLIKFPSQYLELKSTQIYSVIHQQKYSLIIIVLRLPESLTAMSCPRTPPSVSSRAPKKQQQSWDGCSTPPIQLFAPCNNTSSNIPYCSPPRSPTGRVMITGHYDCPLPTTPLKSPKSPRYDRNGVKTANCMQLLSYPHPQINNI